MFRLLAMTKSQEQTKESKSTVTPILCHIKAVFYIEDKKELNNSRLLRLLRFGSGLVHISPHICAWFTSLSGSILSSLFSFFAWHPCASSWASLFHEPGMEIFQKRSMSSSRSTATQYTQTELISDANLKVELASIAKRFSRRGISPPQNQLKYWTWSSKLCETQIFRLVEN